ncbi:class I SAM-dependent methyltransferase [Erythrobacteraceae bacterium WH01K]|nr:class I SAM-dependent methyltransferase [Erythrobacteraceae bacterium WH01K]
MGAREDWSSYWNAADTGSACLPGADGHAAGVLAGRWQDFAARLSDGASVLDLACGRGAAGEAMLSEREDLAMRGVDYADIPDEGAAAFPVEGGVDLADLPLPDTSIDAAISQFGFEYAGEAAAGELARILKPGGACRLLVHHRDSAVVAANAVRADILSALLSGHAVAFTRTRNAQRLQALFDPLVRHFGEHALLLELASACRDALRLPDAERAGRCEALEVGMQREAGLLRALAHAAMDAGDIDRLHSRTASDMDWHEPAVIRSDAGSGSADDGAILCWELDGTKKA